jgi:hypothetical protein
MVIGQLLVAASGLFLCAFTACVKLEKPSALVMCSQEQSPGCQNVGEKGANQDSSIPTPDTKISESDLSPENHDTLTIPGHDTGSSTSLKDTLADRMADVVPVFDAAPDAVNVPDAEKTPDSLQIDSAVPADTRDTDNGGLLDTRQNPIDLPLDITIDASPDIVEGPCSQNGRPAPLGTICRASTDQNACDPIEYCNGTTFDCPTDVIYPRPAAPTGVTASTDQSQQVIISWNESSHATGYNIKRSTESGSGYTTLASIAGSPYIDMQRTSGVTYYYVLTAIHTVPSCESTPSSQVVSAFIIDSNLLGLWHFDETTSPYADASGNGYHGTGVNAPTSGEGKFGAYSLKLNGTSQAVCLPTSMPPPSAHVSNVAWIKMTNVASGTRQTILGYHDDGVGLRFYALSGSLYFQQFTTGASGTFPSDISGQWTHVAGTFDGTTWRVYVNGSLVGTATGNPTAFAAGKFWCIGRKPSQESNYFDGEIDEVRIYKRALSASEIVSLYQTNHL